MKNLSGLLWDTSIVLSRWRTRLRYAAMAPFVYRNWWQMYLARTWSGPTILELRNGTKYSIRPRTTDLSVVNETALLNPYLGPGFFKLSPDATVVDVGANIGDFTVQAAMLCPAGRVYAVEPILGNCECVRQQLELNQSRNVTVLQFALGAKDGQTEIHSAGAVSSAYWGKAGVERVRLTSLESLMKENGIQRIDLLKLDCEGAEWDIFPAAEALLPRIDQICMEYHNGKLTADWLDEWLTKRNFVVRRTRGRWNGILWAWRPKAA
jgi:FkbM family methyltransferase